MKSWIMDGLTGDWLTGVVVSELMRFPAVIRAAAQRIGRSGGGGGGSVGGGMEVVVQLEIKQKRKIENDSLPANPIPAKTPSRSNHRLCNRSAAAAAADSGLNFRRKLLYLQSLNVNPQKALDLNPNLRSTPLSTLHSITKCLSSMGIDVAAVGRILDMYPQLLTADPYADIYPIFDFLLNTVEIPFSEIRKSIARCPRILVSDPEAQLKPAFEFLTELGFVGPNKLTSQTTMLLVSSVQRTLIPKMEFLIGLGIEYDEVKNMVLPSPGLLMFSVEKNYAPKLEYFVKEMNGDLDEIKRFPQYFSFSLERKIKPRHRLLMEHAVVMSLPEMLKVSDGEFNVQLIEKRLRLVEDRRL